MQILQKQHDSLLNIRHCGYWCSWSNSTFIQRSLAGPFLRPPPPLEPWESARIIETFLEVFSELAEDAWSPILEQTWRTALLAMLRTRSITNHIWPCSKNYTASLVFS